MGADSCTRDGAVPPARFTPEALFRVMEWANVYPLSQSVPAFLLHSRRPGWLFRASNRIASPSRSFEKRCQEVLRAVFACRSSGWRVFLGISEEELPRCWVQVAPFLYELVGESTLTEEWYLMSMGLWSVVASRTFEAVIAERESDVPENNVAELHQVLVRLQIPLLIAAFNDNVPWTIVFGGEEGAFSDNPTSA